MKTKRVSPRVNVINKKVETNLVSAKNKNPIDIDEQELIAAGVEEKIEEDPLAAATEEEEGVEEISLDGEELNPFGDRWEE